MKHWRIEDVAWDRFDPERVAPEVVPLVKAAAMVERNGTDYALYLNGVFADDPEFQAMSRCWAATRPMPSAMRGGSRRWSPKSRPGRGRRRRSRIRACWRTARSRGLIPQACHPGRTPR